MEEILVTHWDGEGSISVLVNEILAGEDNLIDDKRKLVLDYIGYST